MFFPWSLEKKLWEGFKKKIEVLTILVAAASTVVSKCKCVERE